MTNENPYRDSFGTRPDLTTNPYAPADEVSFGTEGQIILPVGLERGWVGHVPIVGILMMVHGVAEILAAAGLIVLAFIMPEALRNEAQQDPALQGDMVWFLSALYGTMGLVLLSIGALSIFGGMRVFRYRGYTWGIVALSAGFLTVFGGCWCFPTALAIGIYGFVVMLNYPVKVAFSLGDVGYSASQIQHAFRKR